MAPTTLEKPLESSERPNSGVAGFDNEPPIP